MQTVCCFQILLLDLFNVLLCKKSRSFPCLSNVLGLWLQCMLLSNVFSLVNLFMTWIILFSAKALFITNTEGYIVIPRYKCDFCWSMSAVFSLSHKNDTSFTKIGDCICIFSSNHPVATHSCNVWREKKNSFAKVD